MEVRGNVRVLKIAERVSLEKEAEEERFTEKFSPVVAKNLLLNAMGILDDTERDWEENHNAVEIRDDFHLLRYYLEYLRKYCEGNT